MRGGENVGGLQRVLLWGGEAGRACRGRRKGMGAPLPVSPSAFSESLNLGPVDGTASWPPGYEQT